ncbi:DUF1385 domain-containing protein [Ethanoligenens harbinense]|uniref:DUF1385 domain-containing protein n=1 Tax=Ethanoligenens harbinense (strain DSM 18485 / JCM 12961 / CGMCC 1.5033 / YUAN-3) TaxID=663278 RepID=E6U2W1_ETHHY|nr:DUF1385 domain-containing protein [Ethanoligenens harbinense]ADU27503.1 protein of unknown function DUF1385 [Ethanoligenens harbinense YUAN-3]
MTTTNHRTMIGGQAVIEGVMMRGPQSTAMAVRRPGGEIHLETWENSSIRDRWPILGLPILRGVVSFVEMLVFGYKTLMTSAEISGMLEETDQEAVRADAASPSEQTDTAAAAKEDESDAPSSKGMTAVAGFSMVLGLLLAVGLFLVLPAVLVKYTSGVVHYGAFRSLAEGAVRLGLFVGYLALLSRMEDVKRLYGYHGAEHKTIYCYEHGDELTVENARRYTRLHPRCGTSFLLIVIIIGIVVSSFITWDNLAVRVLLKLLLLPLVVGVSYEIIKFAGRHDTGLMRAVLAPGLWLQKLTTREPDDSQLEVAIRSLQAVLTGNRADDAW